MSLTSEIKVLEETIKKSAREYYLGTPTESDDQFDYQVEKLRQLDPSNELLTTTGWGFNPSEVTDPTLKEVEHLYNIIKFEGKVRDPELIKIPMDNRVVTPKYDGGSIMCYYSSGKLIDAITRGDGVTGFDVTDNVKYLVPEYLNDDFTGMVRGEIIMKTKTFEDKYKGNGYTSARNLATGWSRKAGLTQENLNDLDFIAYTVRGFSDAYSLNTKSEVLKWISDNKFTSPQVMKVDDWSMDSLIKIVTDYRSIYGIDGLVITSENYDEQEDGTWVPNREVAYKIKAETKETTVKKVIWNLTRTMKMVPKAVIEPVVLAEATISNAAAFNAKYVKDVGLGAGAKIVIQRSGEVIPDIVEVLEPAEVNLPAVCPSCGEPLVMKGTDLWCTNKDCPARDNQTVRHYLSTIAPVKGLGNSVIEKFLDLYKIDSIDGLYQAVLQSEDDLKDRFTGIKGVGDRSLGLLQTMKDLLIEPQPLNKILPALNIKGLSGATSIKISSIEGIYDKLKSNDSAALNEINKVVNVAVRASLLNGGFDSVLHIMNEVEGLQVVQPVLDVSSDNLIGVTLTGKLSVPRKEFVAYLKEHGMTEVPITKSALLITDNPDGTSSKNKVANEKKIPKASEESVRAHFDDGNDLLSYSGEVISFD